MAPFLSPEASKTTKLERYNSYLRRVNATKLLAASSNLLFRATILTCLLLLLLFTLISSSSHLISISTSTPFAAHHPRQLLSSGPYWEEQVRLSAAPRRPHGLSVLVTGAAGFVGFHCSLALRRRGDGIVGLDNFNSYYDPSLKRSRQSVLLNHSIFVVEGDINDAVLLSHLLSPSRGGASFTHVLHLAAQAGVRYAARNPLSYVRSNVAGFVSLLEACRSAAPSRPAIVWASSSSVYGLNRDSPFSESHRTDRPASLYAATKKAGEAIAHTYNHIHGLSLTALRFFTVYGPWGRPDMAYFSFTADIVAGRPVTVYLTQDGKEAARDFTYIDDVVSGCLGAIDTAERSTRSTGGSHGPAQLRVYNLGNTSPVPVGEMVGILEGLLGVKAKRNIVKMPANGDVPFTHANVSLAERDFRYRPATDLKTGLKKFVKWYVKYYGIKTGPNKEFHHSE